MGSNCGLYGYDNIDEQNEHGEIKLNKTSARSIKINHINNLMSGLGYSEVINYSFISPSMSMMQGEYINTIDITNPLSIDMSIMRASLFPGLLNNLIHNLKKLFELLFDSIFHLFKKNTIAIKKRIKIQILAIELEA